jgi:flagellar hook assembly protein FlgD
MKVLRAALVLFFALPGAALAAPTSLFARELPARSNLVERTAEPFQLVGLHWQGSGSVRFRIQTTGGRWSAWRDAAAGEDDLPDRGTAEYRRMRGWHVGSPYWVGGADRIQYRLSGSVRRLRGFFVRSAATPSPPLRALSFSAAQPSIITRPQWGANEAIRRNRAHGPVIADNVHLAIVHHTAGSNGYSCSQSAAIVRSIELYHVRGNGWDDIGYNFLVDKCGQIFEGRYGGIDKAVVGAHALGFNYGSVGVALIGNYNSAGVTASERAALVKLLAWRLDVAHVDPLSRVTRVSAGNPRYPNGDSVQLRAISGHRDAYPTSCPGNNVYAQLPSIARQVAATGLPKIYSPIVFGGLGGNVRFTARLSGSVPWTVEVEDALGHVVASGSGTSRAVDFTWDASLAPRGSYTYTISASSGAAQARPVVGTIGQALPQLSVSQLRVQPGVVTPNGDGYGDTATIAYVLGATAQLTVTLADGAGNQIAPLFTGTMTQGAHAFTWRDISIPDGRYEITVTAVAASGKAVSRTASFYVDRTLGRVTTDNAAISPNGDGRDDAATVTFQLAAAVPTRVEIWRAGKRLATLLDQTLPAGPEQLVWDGKLGARVAADGTYDVVVSATDALTTVTQRVSVTVDRTAPRLRLVSAARMQFWISEPARVTARFGKAVVTRDVRRGYFSYPKFRRARHFVLSATDAVGNASRALRR